MTDYERSILYIQHAEWDNLLILMVRTRDHFLAKKIEKFLHAYHYICNNEEIENNLCELLNYLNHSATVHATAHNPFS